jgi:hypothetical protein
MPLAYSFLLPPQTEREREEREVDEQEKVHTNAVFSTFETKDIADAVLRLVVDEILALQKC